MKCNIKKKQQLGMPVGTASARLRKELLFTYAKKCDDNFCYQCKKEIKTVEEFSIEHKIPYLDSEDPVKLFFDLDNIAFSHLSCNVKAGRKRKASHGSSTMYHINGCRCKKCLEYRKGTYLKYEKGKRNKRVIKGGLAEPG